jgi:hypothetical protein
MDGVIEGDRGTLCDWVMEFDMDIERGSGETGGDREWSETV